MEITKADKKEFVKILKEAKKFLWDGKGEMPDDETSFVCCAICDAIGSTEDHKLTDLIDQRLDGSLSVITWLWIVHGIDLKREEEKQAYRFAWVDNMIEEFSS
jgi:hypothetical protein